MCKQQGADNRLMLDSGKRKFYQLHRGIQAANRQDEDPIDRFKNE